MDDDYILEHGGDEEDIRRYAEANGADLTEADILEDDTDYAGPRRGGRTLGTCMA